MIKVADFLYKIDCIIDRLEFASMESDSMEGNAKTYVSLLLCHRVGPFEPKTSLRALGARFPMGREPPQGADTRLCVSPLLGHPLRGLALRARGIRVKKL